MSLKLVVPVASVLGIVAGLLVTATSNTVIGVEDSKEPPKLEASLHNIVSVDLAGSSRLALAKAIQTLTPYEPQGYVFDMFFNPASIASEGTAQLERSISECNIPVVAIVGHLENKTEILVPFLFENCTKSPNNFHLASGDAQGSVTEQILGVKPWQPLENQQSWHPVLASYIYCLSKSLPLSEISAHDKTGRLTVNGSDVQLIENVIPYAMVEKVPEAITLQTLLAKPNDVRSKVLVFGVPERDMKRVSPTESLAGQTVQIQFANVIDQMLHHGLRFASFWPTLFWIAGLALISSIGASMRSPWLALCIPFGTVIMSAFSNQIFSSLGMSGGVFVAPLVATIVAAGLTLAAKGFRQDAAYGKDESFEAAVLIVDAIDSTKGSQGKTLDEMAEFNRQLLNAVSKVVTKNGGVIEATLGDGIYARFRAKDPMLSLNSALNAAKAITTGRGLQVLERNVPMRASIEFGKIVSRTVNVGALKTVTSGLPINMASRLQDIAKSSRNALVVGPDAAAHLGQQVTPLGCFDLKGFDEPVNVSVLGETL